MTKRLLLLMWLFAMSFLGVLGAQSGFFVPVESPNRPKAVEVVQNIEKLSVLRLDESALREYLSSAPLEFQNGGLTLPLDIPLPDGRKETFGLVESSILAPHIAAQHPEIKSYTGNGLSHKEAVIRVTLTANGFHAVILDLSGEEVYFEHYSDDDKDVYFNYFARDAVAPPDHQRGRCGVESMESTLNGKSGGRRLKNNTGGTLRTFRLAMAANGEFTQQNGGTQASAFAEIVNYVALINLVYRRELSVEFILVSGLNLIYDNPATDPYDNDLGLDIDINQTNCDAVIGNANYDIGHVWGYSGPNSGGGLAAFQSVCDDASKAVGGSFEGGGPYAQIFFDQLVLHEMGHQFGMSHSYNSVIPVCTTRNPGTSVEPGAGATIMSYGFTCDTDDYFTSTTSGPFLNFHTANYEQADAYITSISCYTTTGTGNSPPVVTMPSAFTIPHSTPFSLTGSADAPEMGDSYTYSWEGIDIGAMEPDASTLDDTAQPPFFRSYAPSTSPTRTFPILSAILDGTNQARGDKLPSVSFPTQHRFTVRDNNAAGGGLSYGEVTITVDGNIGPFLETTNLAATYPAGSMQNITWSVNGTSAATSTVNILLSVDGGLTFPYTLATATGNDGNEMVTFPNVQTSTARIKVEAVGNIFFDISNFDFSIDIPGCTAANSNICPTDAMTFDQGDAGLNLSLSNTYGAAVSTINVNTSDANPSGELASSTMEGNSICQTIWGVERYSTFDFTVSTTGSYTFTRGTQDTPFSIFVAAGYDPAMPCAGTFLGSNTYDDFFIGSSSTVTLTACTTYKLVAWEINGENITDPISVLGAGTVYSTATAPANTGYTYVAVNTVTNQIVAQSETADFTTLEGGTYQVYGASYKNGGPTPPADVDPATWIGSTLSAVQSADCVVFSSSSKPLTINAGACPDLTAAPANVTITNSACGTGCATTPGNIAAPASPCPVGSTLQYSTDNGVTFSTTLPIYDEVNPITVTTRCSCDVDPTMASPSSAAVTTAPAPCVDPVFTPALVQPTCMADGNIIFSGAGLTFEQSTDGATFTPATSPIVLAQGEQPAVTYTIRATDANGCTTDETVNVAAVTNCGPLPACSFSNLVVSLPGNEGCDNKGTADPSDDTFFALVFVDISNAPTTGTLDVTGDGTMSTPVSFLPPGIFTSEGTNLGFSVELNADGGQIDLTLSFSDDPTCTISGTNLGMALPPCSPPPPPTCDEIVTACYVNNQTNAILSEICPAAGFSLVDIEFLAGEVEDGFDALDIYSGPMGSGTSGTQLANDLEGDLTGLTYAGQNADDCITLVISSDVSVSCQSEDLPPMEICVNSSGVACSITNVVPTDPFCGTGFQTGESFIDITFDVVGGSGSYNTFVSEVGETAMFFGGIQNGLATDGTVTISALINPMGVEPGDVVEVTVVDQNNQSCQGTTFTVTAPLCPPATEETVTLGCDATETATVTGTIGSDEWDWYEFVFDGSSDLVSIDTEGSGFDTELGIYDASGNLVASNDDGPNFPLSLLSLNNLPAGTYYVVVGGFDTDFDPGFDVNTGAFSGTSSGDYSINFNLSCNEAPVANCQNITVDANGDCMGMAVATDFNDGSTDPDGDPLSFSIDPEGPLFVLGSTSVTLTVSDGTLTSTCAATITVEDNTMPDAQCQDVTVQLDANGNGSITAAELDGGSTDNCTITSLSASATAFNCDDLVGSVVAYGGTLATGNSNVNTPTTPVGMDFTVTDPEGIVVTHLGAFDDDLDGIAGSIEVRIYRIDSPTTGTVVAGPLTFTGSTDPLLSLHRMQALVAPVTLPPGQYSIVADGFTNTDLAGNASIAGGVVTTTNGSGVMTFDQSRFGGPGVTGFPTTSFPTPSVWHAGTFQYEVAGGINTVTLTVTDQSGNSSTCDATVTVEDNVPPVAICQPVTVQLDANGNGSTTPEAVNNMSSDNCGLASLALDVMDFTCADVGPNTVTLTVTDVNDNPATCTATATVEDNVPPMAICQNVTVQLDANGNGSTTPAAVNNMSSDNCGLASLALDVMDFSCADVGPNTVTLTVTDVNANPATCTATVTVEDNVPPVAICQNVTVQLDVNGNGSTTPAAVNNMSSDNCGLAGLTLDVMDFTCADVGPNTVTLTVTDVNDNPATCTATVTVEDNVPPMAICQDITVEVDGMTGAVTIDPLQIDNGSTDACGIDTYELDRTDFTCEDEGDNPVVLTVTDVNGNPASCDATVTIEDNNVDFNYSCITNLNVTLGDGCAATVTPGMVLRGALIQCVDDFIISIDDQDTDQVDGCGDHTYSIVLIEDGEEIYNCWGNIFAEDKTAPVIECPVRAGTGTADVPMTMQTVTGTLDGTSPTLVMSDYACFSDALSPDPGNRPYELVSFTVSGPDVYNIGVVADFDSYVAIFAGAFNADEPCSNIIATQDNNYVGDLNDLDDTTINGPVFLNSTRRLAVPLEAGRTYTVMVASAFGAPQFGDFELVFLSDMGNTVSGAGISLPSTMIVEKDLLCTDVDGILFENIQSWVVNADGSLDVAASLAFFRNVAELNAFVAKLSYIGVPVATDNCGDILITVSDMLMESGDCGEISIMRTFRATDRYQNCGSSTGNARVDECSILIEFRRPNVQDIFLPPFTAPIECDETFATDGALGGPDDNPAASVTGFPWIMGAFGNVDLNQAVCNLGANYSDEPRLNVCEGTYKFRREWNIIDWCAAGQSFEWDQYVKVGDFTGPDFTIPGINPAADGGDEDGLREIVVSTSPFDCVAYVRIPALNITDNCSGDGGGTYKITAEGGAVIATGAAGDGRTTQAPVGDHLLLICAEDGCGNESCEEFNFLVRDLIEPYASCDDQLNISIGGGDIANGVQGIHRVYATAAAEGSSDNCSNVTLLIRREILDPQSYDCLDHFDYDGDGRIINDEIRRDPDNFSSPNGWFTPWLPYADFTCCDVGVFDATDDNILVEVLVTDEAGNSNVCWQYVEPEDKLRPYCYAPANRTLSCVDLPLTFPGDIQAAYNEDREGTVSMLNALFGFPTGTDNCRVDTIVENRPSTNLNDCGWGTITRRFEVWQLKPEGDANGNGRIDRDEVLWSTNPCAQLITITETHEFTIDFPEDAASNCADPCLPEIEITMPGCDNILVNDNRDNPQIFAASGDECYKLAITYDVINWCIWDGEYEGTVIKRRTEDDGEALPVDRSVESAERPVLSFVGPNADNLTVVLDRRHPRRQTCGVNVPGDDSRLRDNELEDEEDTAYSDADNEDWRGILAAGRWQYTQFIKVYDDTAPEVINISYNRDEAITALCTQDQVLEDWQFVDPFGTCDAEVNITFDVTDICDGLDGAIDNITLIGSALDGFAVDANRDGDIKANEFVADAIPFSLSTTDGVTYTFSGTFPIIESALGDNVYHALRVVFEDGCGNRTSEYIEFDVIDCKGPAPSCINGITLTLMPQPEGGCAMATWAVDFEASPIYDCTGQGPDVNPGDPQQERVTKFAIYRQTTVEDDPDFVPSANDTGLVLNEEDDETTFVYVYGFDEEGNYDYCTTYIEVEAHQDCGGVGGGNLSGLITTEENVTVQDVEVNLSGNMSMMAVTPVSGDFLFANLPLGQDYTVTPYSNVRPVNGVSTFDLVLMSKHILGVDRLDSPYKMIAADVNRSESITTLDMIQIRKLILNIDTEFANNTSWRFVPANYVFPVPTNPWFEDFPEVFNVNDLAGNLETNFIGVKVGDVNGSAEANELAGDDRNLNGVFNFAVDNARLTAGELYTVEFRGEDMASIAGFQGTLTLNGAELVDIAYGVATAENFGMRFADQGVITASWNGEATSEDVLFSLVVRATADTELSEVVGVSSRYTVAEAYSATSTKNVGINFSNGVTVEAGFEVFQNTPNPFQAETLIGFNLPVDSEVMLTVSDVSGRVLTMVRGDYAAGYNTINLTKQQLGGVTGVLSYTLTAGEHTATKQMVVIE